MSERIYVESGLVRSWCKMDRSEIHAAEISDVRNSEKEVRTFAEALVNRVKLETGQISAELDTLSTCVYRVEIEVAAHRKQLDTMATAFRGVAAALERGGRFEEEFQRATDRHFHRVNERVFTFEEEAKQRSIQINEHSERIAKLSAETINHAESLRKQLDSSVSRFQAALVRSEQELRAEAERLNVLSQTIQKAQQKTASVAAEALDRADKFQHYATEARWQSFWGRLVWIFRGASRGHLKD